MKIYEIGTGYTPIPAQMGAATEIVVEELSTRLVKKGHQVDIYNRKGKNVQDKSVDKNKRNLKTYKGTRIITVPTINKKG